jgi:hypothetical protein
MPGDNQRISTLRSMTPKQWLLTDGSSALGLPIGPSVRAEYEPLREDRALFLKFARTDPTKDDILKFANRYGLLGGSARCWIRLRRAPSAAQETRIVWPSGSLGPMAMDPAHPYILAHGESLRFWQNEINEMRAMLQLWRSARGTQPDVQTLSRHIRWSSPDRAMYDSEPDIDPLEPFYVEPVPDRFRWRYPILVSGIPPGDVVTPAFQVITAFANSWLRDNASPQLRLDAEDAIPHLNIVPNSLLGALWLQLAQAVAGNKEYRDCSKCGEPFELSPDAYRTNRRFCSDKCRSKTYRDKRVEAQRLRAEGVSIAQIASQLHTEVKRIKIWIKGGSANQL